MERGIKHLITLITILTLPIWLIIGLIIRGYEFIYKKLWDEKPFETNEEQ